MIQKRQLGNSDLHITPVGFGAWAIGGGGARRPEQVQGIVGAADFRLAPEVLREVADFLAMLPA